MDLPGYLENIEYAIKRILHLIVMKLMMCLYKIIKFGPISNQTTVLAAQKSNFSKSHKKVND